jgi:hypothetical protein
MAIISYGLADVQAGDASDDEARQLIECPLLPFVAIHWRCALACAVMASRLAMARTHTD